MFFQVQLPNAKHEWHKSLQMSHHKMQLDTCDHQIFTMHLIVTRCQDTFWGTLSSDFGSGRFRVLPDLALDARSASCFFVVSKMCIVFSMVDSRVIKYIFCIILSWLRHSCVLLHIGIWKLCFWHHLKSSLKLLRLKTLGVFLAPPTSNPSHSQLVELRLDILMAKLIDGEWWHVGLQGLCIIIQLYAQVSWHLSWQLCRESNDSWSMLDLLRLDTHSNRSQQTCWVSHRSSWYLPSPMIAIETSDSSDSRPGRRDPANIFHLTCNKNW